MKRLSLTANLTSSRELATDPLDALVVTVRVTNTGTENIDDAALVIYPPLAALMDDDPVAVEGDTVEAGCAGVSYTDRVALGEVYGRRLIEDIVPGGYWEATYTWNLAARTATSVQFSPSFSAQILDPITVNSAGGDFTRLQDPEWRTPPSSWMNLQGISWLRPASFQNAQTWLLSANGPRAGFIQDAMSNGVSFDDFIAEMADANLNPGENVGLYSTTAAPTAWTPTVETDGGTPNYVLVSEECLYRHDTTGIVVAEFNVVLDGDDGAFDAGTGTLSVTLPVAPARDGLAAGPFEYTVGAVVAWGLAAASTANGGELQLTEADGTALGATAWETGDYLRGTITYMGEAP